MVSLAELSTAITACERCPRLRSYCRAVAEKKRRAYQDQVYWGKPVPGFGDTQALLMIVGLAPGAHGGNRTGRIFTGDASGGFLFAALYRAGLCNQPQAISRHDGLELHGVYIGSSARCAPPDNIPTPIELENCLDYLVAEIQLLINVDRILVLGAVAYQQTLRALAAIGLTLPAAAPKFSHGLQIQVGMYRLTASYHVSQRNTNTGLLTPAMFDRVIAG